MKRIILFLLCIYFCFSMTGCGYSLDAEIEGALDASILEAEVERLTEENQELRNQVEMLQAELSRLEAEEDATVEPTPLIFAARLSDYLIEEYSVMKYKADELVANPFNDDELQLPVRLQVGTEIENTGVNVYFGKTDESAIIDSLALYASPDVNTIYFNNAVSALLFVSRDLFSLDISDDTLEDLVTSMTENFAAGSKNISGLKNDGYAILMQLSSDELGSAKYVVSVVVK